MTGRPEARKETSRIISPRGWKLGRRSRETEKEKEIRSRICPLMSQRASAGMPVYCVERGCMWWDEQWGQCVLQTLADALRYIDSTLERRG
ncbi:MAG: hypothetical protein JRD89_00850 [Deltaproteobacteria bacterium]|nr:hypothetical protein [Deltaproteobacteria bacterium]